MFTCSGQDYVWCFEFWRKMQKKGFTSKGFHSLWNPVSRHCVQHPEKMILMHRWVMGSSRADSVSVRLPTTKSKKRAVHCILCVCAESDIWELPDDVGHHVQGSASPAARHPHQDGLEQDPKLQDRHGTQEQLDCHCLINKPHLCELAVQSSRACCCSVPSFHFQNKSLFPGYFSNIVFFLFLLFLFFLFDAFCFIFFPQADLLFFKGFFACASVCWMYL